MPPSRIYLLSPSGVPNFGDEIITKGWLGWLANRVPDAEVWLDCQSPGKATNLLAGIHPRLHVTDTLWRTMWDGSTKEGRHRERGAAAIIRELSSPDYDVGIVRLREMDVIHLIGGGHINGTWPAHIGLVEAALTAKEYGARLVGTGLGLVPVIPGLTRLLAGFDYLSVRDAASAKATGARLVPDDAFLDAHRETSRNPIRSAEFAVCIQDDLRSEEVFYSSVEFVAQYIDANRHTIGHVRYVEAIPGSDYRGFAELSQRIPDIQFTPFTEVWLEGIPVGSNQVWLTTRFHHHIFGSLAGARGIALASGAEYYTTKHFSAVVSGSNWAVVDPVKGNAPAMEELQHPVSTGSHHLTKSREAAGIYLA